MSVADRLERWLIAHPSNPLRLPEAPDPARESVYERLEVAARSGDVLFHGSNVRTISEFQPRDQMTARDRRVRAVFATSDPLWAMFFAVTDRERAIGLWNTCLRPEDTGFPKSRYFFAVRGKPETVWTEGAVYLLPRNMFQQSDISAEWISFEPVEPLDIVRVVKRDFPFADRVFRFNHPEPDFVRLGRLIANGLADALRR